MVAGASIFGAALALSVAAGAEGPGAAASAAPGTVVETPAEASDGGEAGWFLAGRVDARLINLKPSIWLGYGDPLELSAALEAYCHVDTSGFSVGGGLRGRFDVVEARVHARYAIAFGTSMLAPQTTYERMDIHSTEGPSAEYFAVDTIVKAVPRLGRGWLRLEASLTAVIDTPEEYYLMEVRNNAVIKPPWVWTTEIGYLLPLSEDEAGQAGPNVEVVGIPGRDAMVVRVGARLRWKVYPGWQIRGLFMAPVSSPDNIGMDGGTKLEIGVRYHWSL